MGQIDTFIQQVRQRLTLRRSIRTLLWALLAGASVVLVVAGVYALQGLAVPRYWYAVAAGGSLLVALAVSLKRRATPAEATFYADEHFHLRDAVTSSKRFESQQKSGGFYDLQQEATLKATAALDAKAVSTRPPSRITAAAGVLVLAAGLTAFISPSKAVLDRLALEKQTETRTEEVIEELLKEVEELKKTLDEDEKELIDPAELQKWVEQLKATKDQKEAMRQLAELERKLNETGKNMAIQKKDEQLLKKAGEELQKEEDPQARELGKKLEQEKFKQAADKLKEMKEGEKKDGEKKSLDQKKKELAKLKAAAKRMASAARQQKQNRNAKQNGKEQEAKESQEQNLEDLMEEMDQDANELEQAMEEGDEKKCELCEGKLGEKLDKLGKKLGKLDAKKQAQMKLAGLNKKLGQCQSYCQGKGMMPGQMPGGLKPGVGTDESRRSEKDALTDNGQTTQLKGQKDGKGPTLSQIEAADDGTGVSTKKSTGKNNQTFTKQFESFVQREDVPEEVKEGVKNYFKSVHEPKPEATQP